MAPAKKPAGYSGTPLVSKLGIKPDTRIQFFDPPDDFGETLGALPAGLKHVSRGALDFAILFVRRTVDLEKSFSLFRDRLESNGTLWVGWPKKSARTTTDLTENVVREIGLNAGLVDVKVCAIDDTWSGLKFVRRVRDR
ncbi:MAG TPA: DUF3052 domain-containing protein [Gemmatimonadaceae bacterium]|jgi:hypothetical protein